MPIECSTSWRQRSSFARIPSMHSVRSVSNPFSSRWMLSKRLHHVQLQLPVVARQADAHVVPDHLVAHLVHHLRNHRIHLARHDAAPGLPLRQVDLVQAASRSAREQSQVVAHLVDLDGQPLHRRAVRNHARRSARRLYQVVRQRDVPSRDLAQRLDARLAVSGLRADARPYRRRPHIHHQELVRRQPQVLQLPPQRVRKRTESLSQRHGYRILQLRPPHLDYMCKLFALRIQCSYHLLQMRHELQMFQRQRHVDRAREQYWYSPLL